MTPVHSSNLRAAGYDPATKRLRVEFHSGRVYAYEDVAPETHAALMGAASVGQHFHTHIRGKHRETR